MDALAAGKSTWTAARAGADRALTTPGTAPLVPAEKAAAPTFV